METAIIEQLREILEPEPDDDGDISLEYPISDLKKVHGLDAESYLRANDADYEGSSLHPHSRIRDGNERLALLSKSNGVPYDLFSSGLRILADSLVEHDGEEPREGQFHHFPPAILAFWAGFECYLRYASNMMVETVRVVPDEVSNVLLEKDKYHPVLVRYQTLLERGYQYKVNRGDAWWQHLEQARDLRDHFTHIRIDTPRGVTSDEVLDFMDNVLISLIRPSCDLHRSLMLGQYRLYEGSRYLRTVNARYTEKPFFLDWKMERGLHGIHCNFENVDEDRFPNLAQLAERRSQQKRS